MVGYGIKLYRAKPEIHMVLSHAKGRPQPLEGTEKRKPSN